METVQYIDFYFVDNSNDWLDLQGNMPFSWLHCGRVTIAEGCFCNRGFTVKEFKNIVIELRKQEKTGVKRISRDKNNTSRYAMGEPIRDKDGKIIEIEQTQYDELGENLFNLNLPEKINDNEANFESFTLAINKALEDYEINTCIRKIHFLAQAYHETGRFTKTYEVSPTSDVKGGPFYRGRGLIQLTHDYNYENLKNKLKDNSNLVDFVPRVAKEIKLACQAAGYYWKNIGAKNGNISQYADKDDVLTVSKEVNGYKKLQRLPNGYNERVYFTNQLKIIMKYGECENKK
jgi:predicted chitinase